MMITCLIMLITASGKLLRDGMERIWAFSSVYIYHFELNWHVHDSRLLIISSESRLRGNFCETGWSAHGLFRAHRYHLELNWHTYFKIQDYFIILSEKLYTWLNINHITVHNNTYYCIFKTQRTIIYNTGNIKCSLYTYNILYTFSGTCPPWRLVVGQCLPAGSFGHLPNSGRSGLTVAGSFDVPKLFLATSLQPFFTWPQFGFGRQQCSTDPLGRHLFWQLPSHETLTYIFLEYSPGQDTIFTLYRDVL